VEYPCYFIYQPLNRILSWTGVDGANEYEIVCRSVNSPIPDWNIIYTGPEIFSNINLVPDTYLVKGKSKKPTEPHWGEYGPEEKVVISQAS
jgi:hypothetical protein